MFEDFQTKIKAIADNTPDQFKSTINGCMHWIVSQAFLQYFLPKLTELEDRIKELEDGNEERGLQESQGNSETNLKTTRRRKE
jgi:hypothetical protein